MIPRVGIGLSGEAGRWNPNDTHGSQGFKYLEALKFTFIVPNLMQSVLKSGSENLREQY